MILQPLMTAILDAMEAKDYMVFSDARGYDLNLFGIRTSDLEPNVFNDLVGVFYRYDKRWNLFVFPATTDPGTYWRQNPMNVDGTAILAPGQYRGAYRLGAHKGYPALQQAAPMTVHRDPNRDNLLDLDGEVQTGMFGINIHRANSIRPSSTVDRWSAGCQVLQDPLQFAFLMSLANRAADIYGDSFTYTLLTEADF